MASLIQRSLAGGEIGPQLYARTDEVKYATGARKMRNHLIMKSGGSANRPGFVFSGEVKDSSTGAVRLIPFIFNDSQRYVLEFGNLYFRVIKDGVYIKLAAKNITAITQANPGVFTSAAHGYANGKEVYVSGVLGMTELNGRNFKIANVTANTYTLKYMDGTNVDTTAFGAYASGGTTQEIYTVVTPYVTADLPLLKYTQSADVITVTMSAYPPAEVARLADNSWTYTAITFGATISEPGGVIVSGGQVPAPPGTQSYPDVYVITSVNGADGSESIYATTHTNGGVADAAYNLTLTWVAVAGASFYRVYKQIAGATGVFGFIGTAIDNGVNGTFVDIGATPSALDGPFSVNTQPLPKIVPPGIDVYPVCVGYVQQRLCFGNLLEQVFMSQTALYKNFNVHKAVEETDAVTFTMAGEKVNPVKHIMNVGFMVLFTANGEFSVNANGEGGITPSNVVPLQQSFFGSNDVRPVAIGKTAIYVQARGSIIRSLGYQFVTQGYQGTDMTVFAPHLFQGYQIVDLAFQQLPNSIIWAVRNDGVLLGMTFVEEEQIWGWHRHDLQGGFVESIAVIPGDEEDVLYASIRRTINGETKRYVELLSSRTISRIEDSIFMDSAKSYDGRNTNNANTVTLTTATGWDYESLITATTVNNSFTAADVGNGVNVVGPSGDQIRIIITAFVSAKIVRGYPDHTIPANMQGVGLVTWAHAIAVMGELWHLEGKQVSVMGDGFVVASPNNSTYSNVITVTNGKITLDRPYGVIHVGIPYVSDLETLDIDIANGQTMATYKKHINQVAAHVYQSRSFFAGPIAPEEDPENDSPVDPLKNLYETKVRRIEGYDSPIALKDDVMKLNTASTWSRGGRVFIRHVDPVPLAILSIIPAGDIPIGKEA